MGHAAEFYDQSCYGGRHILNCGFVDADLLRIGLVTALRRAHGLRRLLDVK